MNYFWFEVTLLFTYIIFVTSGTQLVVCVIISFLSCGYDSNHRDVINRTLCFFHLQGFDELMWSYELFLPKDMNFTLFESRISASNHPSKCIYQLSEYFGDGTWRKPKSSSSNLKEAWFRLEWSSRTSMFFLASFLFGTSKYGTMTKFYKSFKSKWLWYLLVSNPLCGDEAFSCH